MSFACPREIYDGSLHIPVDVASTHFIMWRPGYKDRQYFLTSCMTTGTGTICGESMHGASLAKAPTLGITWPSSC